MFEKVGFLQAYLGKAEQDTAALKTTAAPVLESKIMSEEDARSAGKAVSEVSVAAKASCKACSDFIVERRMNIDSVKPPLLAPLREEQLKIPGAHSGVLQDRGILNHFGQGDD